MLILPRLDLPAARFRSGLRKQPASCAVQPRACRAPSPPGQGLTKRIVNKARLKKRLAGITSEDGQAQHTGQAAGSSCRCESSTGSRMACQTTGDMEGDESARRQKKIHGPPGTPALASGGVSVAQAQTQSGR